MSSSPAISTLDRERTLQALEWERFDLVVIGGGITGAVCGLLASALALLQRRPIRG